MTMDEEIDRELHSWRSDFYKLKRHLRFAVMRLEDGLKTSNQFEVKRWRKVSNVHASRFAHCSCRYNKWQIMRYDDYESIDRLQRKCNSYVRRIVRLNRSGGYE